METKDEDKVILVNKPLTWTSFQVVKKIKQITKAKKVGHAGTLDPLATGLLIVCTGKMTKQIETFQKQTKQYTGCITLGAETASFDLEKPVINTLAFDHITHDMILALAEKFVGEQTQIPPVFSAIKQGGKPIYLQARKDVEVAIKERIITIYSFEITNITMPNIYFTISCSSGTYIRSIAADFGLKLGTVAHLSALTRTQIGDFNIKDAIHPVLNRDAFFGNLF